MTLTAGWCLSRGSVGRGLDTTAVQQPSLLDILLAQSSAVSEPFASILSCDGDSSGSERSRVVMHNAIIVIRDAHTVYDVRGEFFEIRTDPCMEKTKKS